jgi:hypothetical protein
MTPLITDIYIYTYIFFSLNECKWKCSRSFTRHLQHFFFAYVRARIDDVHPVCNVAAKMINPENEQ